MTNELHQPDENTGTMEVLEKHQFDVSNLKDYMHEHVEGFEGDIKVEEFKGPEHLFFFEAELASQTILKQRTEVPYPGMTWDDSLGNIKVLDMWRKEIGYNLEEDN